MEVTMYKTKGLLSRKAQNKVRQCRKEFVQTKFQVKKKKTKSIILKKCFPDPTSPPSKKKTA
jgi:hypothetical protein